MISALAGLAFALFLPGFLLALIFFRKSGMLEKIMLGTSFSIMLTIAIGIFLGYNKKAYEITGGINPKNVWIAELSITALLAIIVLIMYRKNLSIKNIPEIKMPKINKGEETLRHRRL